MLKKCCKTLEQMAKDGCYKNNSTFKGPADGHYIYDEGAAFSIKYCPWCGTKLTL